MVLSVSLILSQATKHWRSRRVYRQGIAIMNWDMFFVLLVVGFTSVVSTSSELAQTQIVDAGYQTSDLCPGNVLLRDFKTSAFQTRSKIECAAKCAQTKACKSWEYRRVGRQCQLAMQAFNTDCANTESGQPGVTVVQYDNKNFCFNEGHVNVWDGTCACPNATWGERCELIMRDCTDWRRVANINLNAIYWIQPVAAPKPIEVWCRLGGIFPRLSVISHDDDSVNFNQTWEAYKAGFGTPGESSFWIGLEKLHLLTSSASLRLAMIKVTLVSGETEYTSYRDFHVDDEASSYQLTLTGAKKSTNTTIHDCLALMSGARFSTFDRNNGGADCAARYGGGWWYINNTCCPCNIVGHIARPADGIWSGRESDAFWGNASGLQGTGLISGYLAPDSVQMTLSQQDP